MVARNLSQSGSNDFELRYLLSQRNLATDESYRFADANYGF